MKICEDFAKSHNIIFNSSKAKLLYVIIRIHKLSCLPPIYLNREQDSYHERLLALRLYSLPDEERDTVLSYFGKLLITSLKTSLIQSNAIFQIVEVDHVSSPMLTLEDRNHSHTIAFDGELFVYLFPCQNQFVTSQIVLFVASNKDLISTSTVFLISPALLDTTTV